MFSDRIKQKIPWLIWTHGIFLMSKLEYLVCHVVHVFLDNFNTNVFPWLLRLQSHSIQWFQSQIHSCLLAVCCKTLTLRAWSLIKESTSSTPTAKPSTTLFPSLSVYYYTHVLSPGYILLKFHFCEHLIQICVNDSSQLCFAGLCNLKERLGDGSKLRRLILNPPGFSLGSFF